MTTKTKACVLESGIHASNIYEYVMLSIAYERTSLPDIYSLKLCAFEEMELTDEQEAILTEHLSGDYTCAQEFYCAMAKLPA